jgi:predicted phage baseplate assembly protein
MPRVEFYGIPSAPDGVPAFAPDDLRYPECLARLLTPEATSPRARWLREQLPLHTRDALEAWLARENAQPLPAQLSEQLTQAWSALQQTWVPRGDLLGSGPDDRHFVVEIDDEGRGHIRFGDGESGRRPDAGLSFRSAYRVGNGPAGNVGAEAIDRIVFRSGLPSGAGLRVRNPLPAAGGIAPEAIARAKLRIPHAFRSTLQRAVTPADYAAIVMRDFASTVQRAAATLRWTGGGPEVLVAVDPLARAQDNDDLLGEIGRHLERFRRIGHDVRMAWAHQVALDIALTVCVLPTYLRGHVKAAVLDALSARTLPDGRRGFFHPDNFTFAQPVYLSRVIAAAMAVPGVEWVDAGGVGDTPNRFRRFGQPSHGEIAAGRIDVAQLEIARLDNDPNRPENGRIEFLLKGGA